MGFCPEVGKLGGKVEESSIWDGTAERTEYIKYSTVKGLFLFSFALIEILLMVLRVDSSRWTDFKVSVS